MRDWLNKEKLSIELLPSDENLGCISRDSGRVPFESNGSSGQFVLEISSSWLVLRTEQCWLRDRGVDRTRTDYLSSSNGSLVSEYTTTYHGRCYHGCSIYEKAAYACSGPISKDLFWATDAKDYMSV